MNRQYPRLRSTGLWLAALFCVGAVLPIAARADVDFRQIEQDLAGTYSIQLKNGSRQSGKLVSFDEDSLRLEIELGGGSAEMNFTADQISRIAFPGNQYLPLLREWENDPERKEDSLNLYRAYYKQRGPFIQYMEEAELELFVRYARYALEHNEALMAVSIINVLRPHIKDEALIQSLDDAKLLGLFRGGMVKEAQAQARDWVDAADPAGASALGWSILAEIYFTEAQYEDAFWTALYPVAYSGTLSTEHLDACYAFAIAAAVKNRQDPIVERLYTEMREREMNWPDNIPAIAGLEPELVAPNSEAPVTPEIETPVDAPEAEAKPEATVPTQAEPEPEPTAEEPLLPTRIR